MSCHPEACQTAESLEQVKGLDSQRCVYATAIFHLYLFWLWSRMSVFSVNENAMFYQTRRS